MSNKLYLFLLVIVNAFTSYADVRKSSILPSESTSLLHADLLSIEDKSYGEMFLWEKISTIGDYTSRFYAQRFNKKGEKVFKSDVLISTNSNPENAHQLISDGKGGLIITWEQKDPVTEQTDVVAQHIDSLGNKLWGKDGMPLSRFKSCKISPLLISDGTSGAIFVWCDSRNDLTGKNWDIYAQHLTADGKYAWNEDGIIISTDIKDEFVGKLLPIANGGVSIVWNKVISNDFNDAEGYEFCYKKISNKGEFIRAATFLNLPASDDNYQLAGDIVADKTSGFFLGLTISSETVQQPVLYLQHVSEDNTNVFSERYSILIDSSSSSIKDIDIQSINENTVIAWRDNANRNFKDTISQAYAFEDHALPESAVLNTDTLVSDQIIADNTPSPDSTNFNHDNGSDTTDYTFTNADSTEIIVTGNNTSATPADSTLSSVPENNNTPAVNSDQLSSVLFQNLNTETTIGTIEAITADVLPSNVPDRTYAMLVNTSDSNIIINHLPPYKGGTNIPLTKLKLSVQPPGLALNYFSAASNKDIPPDPR